MHDWYYGSLVGTALAVGALHSLAPDHWVPFAAVARARGWSAIATARVTVLCYGDSVAGGFIVGTGLLVAVMGR